MYWHVSILKIDNFAINDIESSTTLESPDILLIVAGRPKAWKYFIGKLCHLKVARPQTTLTLPHKLEENRVFFKDTVSWNSTILFLLIGTLLCMEKCHLQECFSQRRMEQKPNKWIIKSFGFRTISILLSHSVSWHMAKKVFSLSISRQTNHHAVRKYTRTPNQQSNSSLFYGPNTALFF